MIEKFLAWAQGLPNPNDHLIVLCVFVLALAALFFAVRAMRRTQLMGYDNFQRMRATVEELSIAVNDLRGRLSTDLTNQAREITALKEAVEGVGGEIKKKS